MKERPVDLDCSDDRVRALYSQEGDRVPCPFVYARGKRCTGHVVRVEAYKADLEWTLGADGTWTFSTGAPRSHYHLFCSEKGNHAGTLRHDDDRMKFYLDQLPDKLLKLMGKAE